MPEEIRTGRDPGIRPDVSEWSHALEHALLGIVSLLDPWPAVRKSEWQRRVSGLRRGGALSIQRRRGAAEETARHLSAGEWLPDAT